MIAIVQATLVDVGSLAKTALVALVGGTGLTLCFSLAILGATKAADMRESGRTGAAAVLLALGALALLASFACIGVGLLVVTRN